MDYTPPVFTQAGAESYIFEDKPNLYVYIGYTLETNDLAGGTGTAQLYVYDSSSKTYKPYGTPSSLRSITSDRYYDEITYKTQADEERSNRIPAKVVIQYTLSDGTTGTIESDPFEMYITYSTYIHFFTDPAYEFNRDSNKLQFNFNVNKILQFEEGDLEIDPSKISLGYSYGTIQYKNSSDSSAQEAYLRKITPEITFFDLEDEDYTRMILTYPIPRETADSSELALKEFSFYFYLTTKTGSVWENALSISNS